VIKVLGVLGVLVVFEFTQLSRNVYGFVTGAQHFPIKFYANEIYREVLFCSARESC
jgi:hypothetical protein